MGTIAVDAPAEGVRRICIDRPERRNAFDAEVRNALIAAFAEAEADEAVRAIVLGSAHGVFCAGGDISAMGGERTPESMRARMRVNHRFVRGVLECPKPVVAAVEGWAVGAGCGIALLADTVVLGEGATMGIPFFKIGLVPDYGILHTLPRRIGAARARQVLLYGRNYKGAEALAIGLCDETVPDAEVATHAVGRARELARQPRHAFAVTKRQLALAPQSLDQALEFENLLLSISSQTADAKEGRTAFLEKRRPNFA